CTVLAGEGSFSLPAARLAGSRKRASAPPPPTAKLLAALPAVAWLILVAALVLPAAYLFQGFSTWWVGLGRVLAHQEGRHEAFFLGEYCTEGWWSYFPVAFLIKTPVGTLLLILASLVFYRSGRPLLRREVIYLLLPVILLFLAAAKGRINIGLRHILP